MAIDSISGESVKSDDPAFDDELIAELDEPPPMSHEASIGNDIAAKSRRVFNLPTGYYLPGVAEPEEATPLTEAEQAVIIKFSDPDALFEYAARVIHGGPSLEEIDRLQAEGLKLLESDVSES
jgi:hypothetical protein